MPEHTGCAHDFDAHHVIAGENPRLGGIIRCPECDCHSTWGVNGEHPDSQLVQELTELYEASR